MIIQPRPMTTTTTYRDYDWTGLTETRFQQLEFSNMFQQYYQTTANYGGFSSYPNNPFVDFGYSWGTTGGRIVVSGASTFKWQWTVPDKIDTPGVPDLNNFPVPRLYVLASVNGKVSADNAGTDYGDSATDGILRDPWTPAANLLQFSGPVPPSRSVDSYTVPEHGIVLANSDPASNTLLQALFSPTPFVEGTGETETEISMYLEEHPFAIELTDTMQPNTFQDNGGATRLNLFGHPQKLGDGQNQFVYNKAGNLFIPAGINLNGASGDVIKADTDWLISKNAVQVTTDISYTSPAGFSLTSPSGAPSTIVPQTPLGNAVNYNGLVYQGLPAQNSQFGNKTVTLMVDPQTNGRPQPSEVAHIQVFFNPTDKTNPGQTTPNWFYYYSQVDTTPVSYGGAVPRTLGFVDGNYAQITICDGADVQRSIPIVGIRLVNGRRLVQQTGQLDIKGLYSYLQVVGHEKGHIANHFANIEISGGPAAGDADPNDQTQVPTGDGVLDAWEMRNNFDPMSQDTTGAYQNTAGTVDEGKGDRECLADIWAVAYLLAANQQNVWQRDWSMHGLQFGLLPPSAMPPPYFPWTFRPYDSATMTYGSDQPNLPADALSGLSQLDGGGQ